MQEYIYLYVCISTGSTGSSLTLVYPLNEHPIDWNPSVVHQ